MAKLNLVEIIKIQAAKINKNKRIFGTVGVVLSLSSILFSYQNCVKSTDAVIMKELIKSPPTSVSVDIASLNDCDDGGLTLTTYLDQNINGIFDEDEIVKSVKNVCNGANGTNGTSAGITVHPAPNGTCPNGGIVVTTFTDKNTNGLIDSNETANSFSNVCNGSDGTDGTDGDSAQITSTKATANQCPYGGVVYSTSTDTTYPELTIICNGATGEAGASEKTYVNGSVGPMIAGKNYSACHHDFMYIPSKDPSVAGWLIFRHQKNGSADQGIGNTGFNIWNVDITQFSLMSEVGHVNYCSLVYNPRELTLQYTITDKSDGLAGKTGIINLK